MPKHELSLDFLLLGLGLISIGVGGFLWGYGCDERPERDAPTVNHPRHPAESLPDSWHGELAPGAVHGDLVCGTCHDETGDPRSQAGNCVGCHRELSVEHATLVPDAHERCTSCHEPHAPREEIAYPCRACHGTGAQAVVAAQTAHLREVPIEHASEARVTHGGECTSCHNPHSWDPEARNCRACHRDEATLVSTEAGVGHASCLGCHDPHVAPPDAETCRSCHRGAHQDPSGPRGNAQCSSCHRPHGGRPEESATCGVCHGEVHATLRRGSEAHRQCLTCHNGHSGGGGLQPNACQSCHEDHAGALAAPGRDGHGQCVTCHQPHRLLAQEVRSCTGCHSEVIGEHALHQGACTSCHAPHGMGESILVGGQTCSSCHRAQSNPAHMGTHRSCQNCHQPHGSRPPAEQGGWWARCGSCHQSEQRLAQTSTTPQHRSCESCHAVDGLQAPACSTCHGTIGNQLQHAVPQHQQCSDCHSQHGTALPARQTCIGCHDDRQQHFPDAPRCQSCHPFAH